MNKLRPEVTEKSKYWIDKHRYYELQHFCLQYPQWKRLRSCVSGLAAKPEDSIYISGTNEIADTTSKAALLRAFYSERINMIEKAAKETDSVIGSYILKGVTEGCSYDQMRAFQTVPCCRDVYYAMYRKFFWILDKLRQ